MGWFDRAKKGDIHAAAPSEEPPAAGPANLERLTQQIGTELLEHARGHRAGLLSSRFWSDQWMDWAIKDPAFKVQLFRFVDVFPMLVTAERVHDHLVDYLGQPGVALPPGMGLGLKAGGLAKGVLSKTVAGRIRAMAGNFIAGVDAAEALPKLEKLWNEGVAFSVDLLGETCVSHAEAEVYQHRYLDLIETLPNEVARWRAEPRLESDHLGPVPRTNVSIKISALGAHTDPIDFEGSVGRLVEAIRPILEAARRHHVLINFDIEQAALKDLTLALFETCCEQLDFPAGLALQAYLRSGEEDAGRLIDWARRTGRQVTVRLIKGAYWDYELIHAERMGWPVPVWTEKRDTDACEAIDFCEYYARSAVGLFRPERLGQFVGELKHAWYEPRGVAAVIGPWNFPLAISAGMTTAALVTGNTAVVKPSSQTRGIARAICEILWSSGVPGDVLQFLPGPGGSVGGALVRDPRVALIAFTGSKEVGLDIIEAAGRTPDEQGLIKKVVCEMGGKNAVIVDDTADLDEAVLGVRASAFGYSGQKCSACSRVIVLEGVHDPFLKRLIESTRTLVVGDPADPATDVGPVIDEPAARKIRRYIEIGRDEGTLELACEVPPGLEARVGKPYIGPHIFSGIRPEHRLAHEEIFGPVLSVIRGGGFAEALKVANATRYKLTGGVFSRKPSHLEAARRKFRVGNLYLNRGITGALVGRQPFGGFGLSGTGTKAGGADYLLHFVQPRSCAENTMQHGYAPGLD